MADPQLDLFRRLGPRGTAPASAPEATVWVDGRSVTVRFERHPRARRYRLTLLDESTARCTLPPRGSLEAARAFVERCHDWLARRIARRGEVPSPQSPLADGMPVWFRGRKVPVRVGTDGTALHLGEEMLPVPPPHPVESLRAAVNRTLREWARTDLPPRVEAFAGTHGLTVRRITIRDQRSRWGSCSRLGTLSLNWRLVQLPDPVRDYIILHELAHLRHLNHSARFWAEVARLCPGFAAAETWLRRHGREIL